MKTLITEFWQILCNFTKPGGKRRMLISMIIPEFLAPRLLRCYLGPIFIQHVFNKWMLNNMFQIYMAF